MKPCMFRTMVLCPGVLCLLVAHTAPVSAQQLDLPNPLELPDSSLLTTEQQWSGEQRRRVLDSFEQQVYGKVLVRLPAADVVARMGPWLQGGGVEPVDDESCLLTLGARTHADLAFWIGVLDADFQVVDPPELAEAVARMAHRYARAAG